MVCFTDLYKSVDGSLTAEERIKELCKLCAQVYICIYIVHIALA